MSAIQVLILVFCAYKIVFDPFSVEEYSDRFFANLYNVAFSPFYGSPSTADPSVNRGQNEIVVLLYDDIYLDQAFLQWPVEPGRYTRLLRSLDEAGALGVFLDVQFLGSKDRNEAVANLFRYAEEIETGERSSRESGPHMPVFFAHSLESPLPIYAETQAPNYALFDSYGLSEVYDLKNDEVPAWHSPEEPHRDANDSAAYALFKLWCERKPAAECEPIDEDAELFIEWGYGPDPAMAEHYFDDGAGIACQQAANSISDKVISSARMVWSRIRSTGRTEIDNPAPCPYHRNFSVGFFNTLPVEEREELFRDKIVLIGAYVRGFLDHTESPVHQQIPGVFRHAMALDNLIEHQGSFVRWVDDRYSMGTEIVALALIFASYLFFNARAFAYGPDKNEEDPQQERVDNLYILYAACVGLFLLLIVGTNIALLHWDPHNWMNFLLIFSIVGLDAAKAWMRKSARAIDTAEKRTGLWPWANEILVGGGLAVVTAVVALLLLDALLLFLISVRLAWPWPYLIQTGIYGVLLVFLSYTLHSRLKALRDLRCASPTNH